MGVWWATWGQDDLVGGKANLPPEALGHSHLLDATAFLPCAGGPGLLPSVSSPDALGLVSCVTPPSDSHLLQVTMTSAQAIGRSKVQ